MKEAFLYQKLAGKAVQCQLCHQFCRIKDGGFGFCSVRQNIDGILYSLNYGKVVSRHLDPIEKKPLCRFLPGTLTYSIASAGCNFRCLNCQNADISRVGEGLLKINESLPEATPEEIIKSAMANGAPSIAYTYTEPTVFAEFALDLMKSARGQGLKNIWVTNGYMSPGCLALIFPYLDAANVDLKFFSEKSYRQMCGAKLQPVSDNLVAIKRAGVHLEVTTLIIPTLNDSPEELAEIAEFIFQNLGAETPWHVSAFHPAHQLGNLPATPPATVLRAKEIGIKTGLKYVYAGNI